MVKQTTYRRATLFALAFVVLLVVVVIVVNKGFGVDPTSSARSSVGQFGTAMQKVSLLSADASSTIASIYGPYVMPELIQEWQKNPVKAPGRLTSGPWPARIIINSISKQGSGYIVNGSVVLATGAGSDGTVPVVMQVVQEDGRWLIAAYQEQAATSTVATTTKNK